MLGLEGKLDAWQILLFMLDLHRADRMHVLLDLPALCRLPCNAGAASGLLSLDVYKDKVSEVYHWSTLSVC